MPRGTASAWTPPPEVTARTIRIATRDDAAAIAAIYNPFIRDTTITFEETEVSADEIAARIADVAAASLPWYVAEDEGRIAGYAYATRWRARSAYRYAVEVTVYVDPAAARPRPTVTGLPLHNHSSGEPHLSDATAKTQRRISLRHHRNHRRGTTFRLSLFLQ